MALDSPAINGLFWSFTLVYFYSYFVSNCKASEFFLENVFWTSLEAFWVNLMSKKLDDTVACCWVMERRNTTRQDL
ncbi:hypothetical protein Nmel_001570 [Mimus melanotis]